MTERYCTNCRAELPKDAEACPQCGVFAGDMYDDRKAKKRARGSRSLTPLLVAFVLLIAAAAGWYYWEQYRARRAQIVFDIGSPRVVRQRPGGRVNEAEAIRTLRRTLAPQVKSECLVVSSQGLSGGVYRLTALDRCGGVRLGRYNVDAKTGAVSQFPLPRAGEGQGEGLERSPKRPSP